MTEAGVLGLDLTASPRRPTAAVALGPGLNPRLVGFATDDTSIREMARRLEPALIAIDAPLSLPQGLCCLEPTCPCGSAGYPKRSAELGLARRGIGCYFTTKKSIIKAMVYRGVSLAAGLRAQGFEVIEVYPYASKVRLWGKPIPRKSTLQGIGFLRQRLGELLPRLQPCLLTLNHDLADAAVAAYTGWLHLQGRSQVVGGQDGLVVLPSCPPGG